MYMIVAAGLQTGSYRPAASMIGGLEKKSKQRLIIFRSFQFICKFDCSQIWNSTYTVNKTTKYTTIKLHCLTINYTRSCMTYFYVLSSQLLPFIGVFFCNFRMGGKFQGQVTMNPGVVRVLQILISAGVNDTRLHIRVSTYLTY